MPAMVTGHFCSRSASSLNGQLEPPVDATDCHHAPWSGKVQVAVDVDFEVFDVPHPRQR